MKRSICLIFALTVFALALADTEIENLDVAELTDKPRLVDYATRLIDLGSLSGVTKEELPKKSCIELLEAIRHGLNEELAKRPEQEELIKKHIASFEGLEEHLSQCLYDKVMKQEALAWWW